MCNAWEEFGRQGGRSPRLSGVFVPGGGPAVTSEVPSVRRMTPEAGDKVFLIRADIQMPGFRIRHRDRRSFEPRGVYIWGAQTA